MLPITDEEIAQGPNIPALEQCQVVQQIDKATVRLVDAAVPETSRFEIARVAYAAQRSMPRFKTGYDGTVTEDDQRLYVLTEGSRAIGFVLTALQDRFWSMEWATNGEVRLSDEKPLLKRSPAIARVWMASNKRRVGLGVQLMKVTLGHLKIDVSLLGWEFPFTESGTALVRRLCPHKFFACCDPLTLVNNSIRA